MSLDPDRKCGSCKFWLKEEEPIEITDDNGKVVGSKWLGECRALPPDTVADGSQVRTYEWPKLWESEYCFSWKDKSRSGFILPDLGK